MATPLKPFLPVHQRAIARRLDRVRRKAVVDGLDLLQAGDVGLRFGEPVEQAGQARADAVDVEGRDLHALSQEVSASDRERRAAAAAARGIGVLHLERRRPHRLHVIDRARPSRNGRLTGSTSNVTPSVSTIGRRRRPRFRAEAILEAGASAAVDRKTQFQPGLPWRAAIAATRAAAAVVMAMSGLVMPCK